MYSLVRHGCTEALRVLGVIRSSRGTLLFGDLLSHFVSSHTIVSITMTVSRAMICVCSPHVSTAALPLSYTVLSWAMSLPSAFFLGPSTSAASDSLVQTLLDRIEGALLKKYSRTELLKSKKYRRSPSSFLSSSSSVRSIPIRHWKKDLIAPPRKRICRPSRFTLRFSCS